MLNTMSKTRRVFFLLPVLLIILALGISLTPRQQELVNLLRPEADLLNLAQIDLVYEYSKLFPNGTELALTFIKGDSVKYVGVRREENTLKYVSNADKIFEIGSISKTFTATALARLIYEKKVRLNEPIKNLLPIKLSQSARNGVEITLLHLANHTSGLPPVPDNLGTDYSIPGSPYQYYDEEKLYDFLAHRLSPGSVPGQQKLYSNLGGGLLGHILTLITQKSYEELIVESICAPLGMTNTCVKLRKEHLDRLVPGRDPDGHVVKNWDLNILAGAGEIKSTAADLVKYIQAFIADTTSFYQLALQPTFQVSDNEMMALGWGIYKLGDKTLYPAFGGTGGYSCGIIFDKTHKNAIILLSNVSAFLSARGDYIPELCRALGQ